MPLYPLEISIETTRLSCLQHDLIRLSPCHITDLRHIEMRETQKVEDDF